MKLQFKLIWMMRNFGNTKRLNLCDLCRHASQNRQYVKLFIECRGNQQLYPTCLNVIDKFWIKL